MCEPSVALHDTAGARVVGDGTPGSCTEAALRALAEQGGAIVFDCGADPVTIDITATIELPIDEDTIIDGGGLVTLDAGKRTRHFMFYSNNWEATETKVVLQRLKLINGKAPAGEYFPPIDGHPTCAYGYKEGGGGTLFMRDGVLHVIDCEFYDNEAALVGPDVGGGALYVQGSRGVVISGSRFVGNRAANGGAVGFLYANPEIYNSHFEDNTAEGTGRNYVADDCPTQYAFNHDNQGGAGGLAGAVYFDGINDDARPYVICGATFRNNRANELAGALFRTPNAGTGQMRISDSTFDSNTSLDGGATFIMDHDVVVERSLFVNNQAGKTIDGNSAGGGWAPGLWVSNGSIDITNSTFVNNHIALDGDGSIRNATLVASDVPEGMTIDNSVLVDVGCEPQHGGGRNVQWPNGEACTANATFADPELGELADNGGPTLTMLPGNVDAVRGVGAGCPAEDQRGEPRAASSCAAGAVEP